MSRIAVAGFFHETNTFSPYPADLAAFKQPGTLPGLTEGDDIFLRLVGLNVPVAGAMERLSAAGHQIIPTTWASAVPSGPVTREAFEAIADRIVEGIAAASPDAAYLDLHGAMVSEQFDDGEGELLRRVRSVIGFGRPLAASFDLHGNISAATVEALDAIAIFETYPHLDMAATGKRAANQLLARLERGGEKLFRIHGQLPYLIPLHAQGTDMPAAAGIYASVREIRHSPLIAAVEFALGFPPADIRDCGPSFAVFATDPTVADAAANHLHDLALRLESEFDIPVLSAAEAVRRALSLTADAPVVIADTQDNPGAGGAGDTVTLLRTLIEQDAQDAVVALLHDPSAAREAHQIGMGGHAVFRLGAHSRSVAEEPLVASFTVEALGDGNIVATGPMYRGNRWAVGATALLRHRGVSVIVAERRLQAADSAILQHVGLDPLRQKVICLKSTVHFRADFARFAKHIIVAKAPGLHLAVNSEYGYRNLRAGVRLMPFGA